MDIITTGIYWEQLITGTETKSEMVKPVLFSLFHIVFLFETTTYFFYCFTTACVTYTATFW